MTHRNEERELQFRQSPIQQLQLRYEMVDAHFQQVDLTFTQAQGVLERCRRVNCADNERSHW